MHTVRMAASRDYPQGWVNYDEQYRLRKALSPSSSWGVVDMELWMLCVSTPPSVNTTIGSVNSPAYSSGLNSANAQHQNNRGLVCRNINRGFQCKFGKNCRYSHRCTKCNGIHPMTNCRLKM